MKLTNEWRMQETNNDNNIKPVWKWKVLSHVQLFATPWTLHSWNSPGQNIEVDIPFSKGSSQPRDRTEVSCIAGGFFTCWATREAQEYWSG